MAVVTQRTEDLKMPDEVWERTAHFFQEVLVPTLQKIDPDVEQSTLKSTPVLTLNGEPFVAATGQGMAFRLSGTARMVAWKLDGSKLWDPTLKMDRPPRQDWVIVRDAFIHDWLSFAKRAREHAHQQPV